MWRSLVGAGVLIIRNGRVLMVARERDGLTRWELPSGLAESGESLEEAATRETLEETAVVVAVGALLCTVVIDVPAEEYRAINAYFQGEALDDRQPAVSQTLGEPIRRADYIDLASLRPEDIHPVDWRILTHWRQQLDQIPFHLAVTL